MCHLGRHLADRRCVTWRTDDRVTWQTADAAWLAQLERSNSGRHVSLAIYHHGVYQGRQDASGFHLPMGASRGIRSDAFSYLSRLSLSIGD